MTDFQTYVAGIITGILIAFMSVTVYGMILAAKRKQKKEEIEARFERSTGRRL